MERRRKGRLAGTGVDVVGRPLVAARLGAGSGGHGGATRGRPTGSNCWWWRTPPGRPSNVLKSRKRARCGNFRRPKASWRCGGRCCLRSLDGLGRRWRSGPCSLRDCSQMPCLVFLPTFLLFPPQRHLAFRLLSFTLGRLPAFLLFPTQSGLTLGRLSFAPGGLAAFLLFAPQSSLTLGRWGLLTRGDSREALLKRAARFVSA